MLFAAAFVVVVVVVVAYILTTIVARARHTQHRTETRQRGGVERGQSYAKKSLDRQQSARVVAAAAANSSSSSLQTALVATMFARVNIARGIANCAASALILDAASSQCDKAMRWRHLPVVVSRANVGELQRVSNRTTWPGSSRRAIAVAAR